MIVRAADLERDAGAILAGAKDFISRMDFIDALPSDDAGLAVALDRMTELEGVEIAVAEEGKRILGCIGMLYAPFAWNPAVTIATELFIWTDRAAPVATLLRLLRHVEGRIRERGATLREFVALSSSPPGLDRIYHRMGLRETQRSFMGVA